MSPAWFAPLALVVTLAGWAATAALFWHRTHTDALTGLGNRAGLAVCVRRAARRWTLPGGPRFAGLLLIDLDEFKQVNDTYGHRAGDAALCAVADRLRGVAPGSRNGHQMLPVRLHGDEFAVWLGVTRDPAELETRRTEVAAALASVPVLIEGRTVAVSCSVGGTVTGQYPVLLAMLAAADRHMYAAKSTRRAGMAAALPRQTRRRDIRRDQAAQGGTR